MREGPPAVSRKQQGALLTTLLLAALSVAWLAWTPAPDADPDPPETPSRPERPAKEAAGRPVGPPPAQAPGQQADDALAACTFERRLLAGQVDRCAGTPLSWADSVDPIEQPDAVERGLLEHLAGTPVELTALDCAEYPCVARLEVSAEHEQALDEAMEWIESGEAGYAPGYARHSPPDRIVETRALMAQWPDEAQRFRLQTRRRRLGRAADPSDLPRTAPAEEDGLDGCRAALAGLRRELAQCEGTAPEWSQGISQEDREATRARYEAELSELLAPSEGRVELVDCQEHPCIALLAGAQPVNATTLDEAGVEATQPFKASDGQRFYLLVALEPGEQTPEQITRVRARQRELLQQLQGG